MSIAAIKDENAREEIARLTRENEWLALLVEQYRKQADERLKALEAHHA